LSYLLDINRNLDLRDIFRDVSFQRLEIDRLSHGTGHFEVRREVTEGAKRSWGILRGAVVQMLQETTEAEGLGTSRG